MKPKLVINNSTTSPSGSPSSPESPEIRLAAAWRAMQGVMQDHLKGELGEAETLEILAGYLNDRRLDTDAETTER